MLRLFLLVVCQRASQEVRFTPAHGHGNDQGAGLDGTAQQAAAYCLALELTSDYVVKPRCVSVFGGRIRCCHLFGRRPVFGSLIFLGVVSVSNWHRNFTLRRSGREKPVSQFHTHPGLMILLSHSDEV